MSLPLKYELNSITVLSAKAMRQLDQWEASNNENSVVHDQQFIGLGEAHNELARQIWA